MSNEHIRRAWLVPGLTTGERMVLVILADHADDDGRCWPGQTTISEKACMTRRGVQKAVARLAEKGAIRVRPGDGRGNSSRYLVLPKGEQGAPFAAPATAERVNHVRPSPLESANSVHPSAPERANEVHPLEPERANSVPERANSVRPNPHEEVRGGGGGSAHAREAAPVEGPPPPLIDRLPEAAGFDLARDRIPPAWCSAMALPSLTGWRRLGLTDSEIEGVIRQTRPRDGPAQSPAYYRRQMERLAADKAAASKPIPHPDPSAYGGPDGQPAQQIRFPTAAERAGERSRRRTDRLLAAADALERRH